jgi:hypothetical protein
MSCGCVQYGTERTTGEWLNGQATPEYNAYHGAKSRCQNPNNHKFSDYGGRGIKFRFHSFAEFLAEVGRKPSQIHTLDRINVNGHYEIGNVRWADPVAQGRNKRNNLRLTANGETRTISEWADITGIGIKTLTSRVYLHKWCHSCTVNVPINKGKHVCSHLRN